MGSPAVSRYALLAVVCILVAGLAHAGESVTVAGEVFGPDGIPADGVPIWAVYSSVEHTREVAETVTGDAGRFSLALLVDDPFQPVALIARTERLGDFIEVLPGQQALMQLRPAVAIHKGVVRDTEGKPIAGATVGLPDYVTTRSRTAVDLAPLLPEMYTTITDADGCFGLADFGTRTSVGMEAVAPGYCYSRCYWTPPGPAGTWEITLQPESSLVGRVLSDGKPVEGVTVLGRPQWGQRNDSRDEAITDADGRYELHSLIAGTFDVVVRPTGDLLGRAREGVVVGEAQRVETPDIELEACGFIRGRAVDAGTGTPVEGYRVRYSNAANPPSSGGGGPAFTDDTGFYEIRVPPGTTTLHAYPMGIRGQSYKPGWESTEVDVTAGHVVDAPVLQLERSPDRMRDGWRDEPRAARPGEIALSVKLEEDSQRISAYEPVVGLVEMTNHAGEPVSIYSSGALTTRIQVRDSAGRLVAITERPEMPLDVMFTGDVLEPGATATRKFVFSALYTFSEPGEYEVRVQQLQFDHYFPLLAEGRATVAVEPFDAARLQARCEELMKSPGGKSKIIYSVRHDIALPYLERLTKWNSRDAYRAIHRIDTDAAHELLARIGDWRGGALSSSRTPEKLDTAVTMWDIEIE